MTTKLSVEGMACDGCEANVEAALAEVAGVTAVEADHAEDTVVVEGDADRNRLLAAVDDAGYETA